MTAMRVHKLSFMGLLMLIASIRNMIKQFVYMSFLLPSSSYNNAYFAKVGGISTEEMNLLEMDFLFGLGFDLNVTAESFFAYCSYLQKEMLLQSPLQLADSPLNLANRLKLHCSFNEDESTHQKQLAAV